MKRFPTTKTVILPESFWSTAALIGWFVCDFDVIIKC